MPQSARQCWCLMIGLVGSAIITLKFDLPRRRPGPKLKFSAEQTWIPAFAGKGKGKGEGKGKGQGEGQGQGQG